MRNQSLQVLYQQLRAEIGHATSSAVGQSEADSLKTLLNRTYEFLFDEWDWPHLKGVWYDVTLAAGQRYYNLPTQINYERACRAFYLWGSEWIPLPGGFDPTAYNSFNSDDDVRSDPPQMWRLYNATQFEVWPMPATNGGLATGNGVIRWMGVQKFVPLVSDNDVCGLDDRMIVLFAAAEKMAGKARGKTLETLAARRFAQMKARSNKNTEAFRIGENEDMPRRQPREIVIRVAGA